MTKARRAGRKRKDTATVPPIPWDHGATGHANRIGLVVEDRGEPDPTTGKTINPNGVTGARRYDMLEVYAKREVITSRGHAAGLVLREAWLRTEMGQSSPFARESVDSSMKTGQIADIMIDRISGFRKAHSKVSSGDEEILSVVVCDGQPVSGVRRYRAMMHGVGLMHLRDALERLADAMEGLNVSAQAG